MTVTATVPAAQDEPRESHREAARRHIKIAANHLSTDMGGVYDAATAPILDLLSVVGAMLDAMLPEAAPDG